jgi:hypothetical protein
MANLFSKYTHISSFSCIPSDLTCSIYCIREYLLQLFDVSFNWGRVVWLAAVDMSKIDIQFNSAAKCFKY